MVLEMTKCSSHSEVKVKRVNGGWSWVALIDGSKVGSGFTFVSEREAVEQGENCIKKHRYDNLVDDSICPFCGSQYGWNGQMCSDCGGVKESRMAKLNIGDPTRYDPKDDSDEEYSRVDDALIADGWKLTMPIDYGFFEWAIDLGDGTELVVYSEGYGFAWLVRDKASGDILQQNGYLGSDSEFSDAVFDYMEKSRIGKRFAMAKDRKRSVNKRVGSRAAYMKRASLEVYVEGDFFDGTMTLEKDGDAVYYEVEGDCDGVNGEDFISIQGYFDPDDDPVDVALEVISDLEFEYGDDLGINEHELASAMRGEVEMLDIVSKRKAVRKTAGVIDELRSELNRYQRDENLDIHEVMTISFFIDWLSDEGRIASRKTAAGVFDMLGSTWLTICEGTSVDGERVEATVHVNPLSDSVMYKLKVNGDGWHDCNSASELDAIFNEVCEMGSEAVARQH